MSGETVRERLAAVRQTIAEAAARAGRDPSEVTLVAVSKRHPAAVVDQAAAAGVTCFGESFAQELAAKVDQVSAAVTWHFIGHLQRNKVKLVVGPAALIHGVDSERLLRAIDNRATALGLVQPILLEVNVGGEASKGGIATAQAAELAQLAGELPGVRLDGLMTMPPLVDRPEDNRPHFRALRALRDQLATTDQPLAELSMGTTADYPVAVEEGATLVRVGTAIFGPRPV